MFSTILFDLDGTLVDLCEIHRAAFRRALEDYSDAPRPRYSGADSEAWFLPAPGADPIFESDLEALPTKEKLRKLGVVGPLALQVAAAKQLHTTSEENLKAIRPNPQLVSMLRGLRARVPLGCVTNSVSASAHAFLDRAGLLPYMDVAVSNEDAPRPKPAPDLYLAALDRLGLSENPGGVLVLEDHPKGIAAAEAAGCVVLPATHDSIHLLGPLLHRILDAKR